MKAGLRSFLILLLVFSLFILPSVSKAVCEESKSSILKAENTSGFEKKLGYYTEALETCPDSMEVLSLISDLYIDFNYYDAAYGVVYRMLSLSKFNADAYYKLAYIYMKWEEYDKAEESALKALEINNYYINLHLLLGDVKYYSRDYKAAMKSYQKAIELDPNNPEAYLKIANVFFLFEKYDKVIAYLDKALAVEKTEKVEMLKELIDKNIQNDYLGVKATAKKILATDPNNLMALETLSMAMLENEKEKSRCLEVLTRVYYLEKQPFMKNKVEKEIEKIISGMAKATIK